MSYGSIEKGSNAINKSVNMEPRRASISNQIPDKRMSAIALHMDFLGRDLKRKETRKGTQKNNSGVEEELYQVKLT